MKHLKLIPLLFLLNYACANSGMYGKEMVTVLVIALIVIALLIYFIIKDIISETKSIYKFNQPKDEFIKPVSNKKKS